MIKVVMEEVLNGGGGQHDYDHITHEHQLASTNMGLLHVPNTSTRTGKGLLQ